MTVRVTCPNPDCGAVASVEEQSLGRRGRCGKCGQVFALARPGGEPASADSGDASAWKGRDAASPTNLPEQFGRYRIMKQLGQGGMGAVYLAHDTRLDRPVALKVPFFSPADGPQAVQRFYREARAAATLDHPNLCPVYDVGEVDGIHYLTMPYIEGKPLSEALATDQTFAEPQAAAVVRKLALALQEAHDKGVVHRDLKPANIMIKRGRDLVIMDFGLARMAGVEDGPLTRTGHVLGTALYMAPEQAAGDVAAVGPACDVYALGVILHELLTGRRPFEGPWSLVIGLKNVKDPDPPSKHRPGLSPALDAICLKAIAQRPGDRYPTMAEFADALAAFLARPSGPSPSSMPEPTASPTRNTDQLAAQVFSGLVSREETSLREEKGPSRPKPAPSESDPPRPLARTWIIAAAGAVVALLLGVIIYVATDKGRIKIEVNDPRAVVQVDGKDVRIEGLGEPITLSTGEHNYLVRWGNGEFTTDRFVVKRGANEDLVVTFEPKPKGLGDPTTRKTPPRGQPEVDEAPARTARNPAPRTDARSFQGKLFKVFDEELTWHEARTKCEAMGGHLAIVTSEAENKFIVGLISDARLNGAWLGATDEKTEGRWLWVDGTAMWVNGRAVGYNDWDMAAQQPNNKLAGEHYLMSIASRDGKWSDQPDRSEQWHPGFVCQWETPDAIRRPAFGKAETPSTSSKDVAQPDQADIANFLGMRLELIPAGEFAMGSDDSDPDADVDEKVDGKPHRVRITRPFYLGATEVTVGQFRQFAERTGYRTDAEKDGWGGYGWDESKGTFEQGTRFTWRSPGFPQADDHPVVNVSWNDAMAFCEWLSKAVGRTYRLPTEAEWEYACRAGTRTRFSSGDDLESLATVGNVPDATARAKFPEWTATIQASDGHLFTAPVGRFRPNAWGLFDMHGNVWEWCADGFGSDYYAKSPPADPRNTSTTDRRVHRGGGWNLDPRSCRSADRYGGEPISRYYSLGFRVAREGDTAGRPSQVLRTPAGTRPRLPVSLLSGTWMVEGDELVEKGGGGTVLLGDSKLSSYDLRFEGQIVSGNEGFNALFHRTNQDNFYFFHVGELAGKAVVAGFVFEGKEGGQSRRVATAKGRWYEILIKVRGPEFWFYLDGAELFHDVDEHFSDGRIGLATWDGDARYRGIRVTTPEGRPLWEGVPELAGQEGAGGRDESTAGPPKGPSESPANNNPPTSRPK